jgi:hypothetical protein
MPLMPLGRIVIIKKTLYASILIFCLLLTVVGFSSCQGIGVLVGSGTLVTRDQNFQDFTVVEAASAFNVQILYADTFRVTVTADDNIMEHVQISQEGTTLKLGLGPALSYSNLTLKAAITLPVLTALTLSGAARGTVEGFQNASDFSLNLSGGSTGDLDYTRSGNAIFDLTGASRVTGYINAADTTFKLSGASKADIEGSAGDMAIDASGGSVLNLSVFPVHSATVTLSGGSKANIALTGRLSVDLSGGSQLNYEGDAVIDNVSISGGSRLEQTDDSAAESSPAS